MENPTPTKHIEKTRSNVRYALQPCYTSVVIFLGAAPSVLRASRDIQPEPCAMVIGSTASTAIFKAFVVFAEKDIVTQKAYIDVLGVIAGATSCLHVYCVAIAYMSDGGCGR